MPQTRLAKVQSNSPHERFVWVAEDSASGSVRRLGPAMSEAEVLRELRSGGWTDAQIEEEFEAARANPC